MLLSVIRMLKHKPHSRSTRGRASRIVGLLGVGRTRWLLGRGEDKLRLSGQRGEQAGLGREAQIPLASIMSSIWQSLKLTCSELWTYRLMIRLSQRWQRHIRAIGPIRRQSLALTLAELVRKAHPEQERKTIYPKQSVVERVNLLQIDKNSKWHNCRENTPTTSMTNQKLTPESKCKQLRRSNRWDSLDLHPKVRQVRQLVIKISNLWSRRTIWKRQQHREKARPKINHVKPGMHHLCRHKQRLRLWVGTIRTKRRIRTCLDLTLTFQKNSPKFWPRKCASSSQLMAKAVRCHEIVSQAWAFLSSMEMKSSSKWRIILAFLILSARLKNLSSLTLKRLL